MQTKSESSHSRQMKPQYQLLQKTCIIQQTKFLIVRDIRGVVAQKTRPVSSKGGASIRVRHVVAWHRLLATGLAGKGPAIKYLRGQTAKKPQICLVGKSMTPLWGNTTLFCSSQQLLDGLGLVVLVSDQRWLANANNFC